MAFRSSGSNGGWINPAGANAFTKAADEYRRMSKAVTHEASLAAETHILTPARKAGAHPATQVYLDGESLMLGVPDDHPQYQQAMNQEFGTQTAPAGGQVRHSIRTNLEAAQQSFAAGLEHAGQTTKWGRS